MKRIVKRSLALGLGLTLGISGNLGVDSALCSAAADTTVEEISQKAVASRSDGLAIDEAHFPDAIFRDYISSQCDKDKDGKLSEQEIIDVKIIDVYSKGIENLKGIEYFTALISLKCNYTKLSSLDVRNNTTLKFLICDHNNLSDLILSNNTALEDLDCNDNDLSSLNLSDNTALKHLNCFNNDLNGLDVRNNTALEYLSCDDNNLSILDVRNNTALTTLLCCDTNLSSLDVRNNTALKYLDCSMNNLNSLDLSNNTALKSLHCHSTNLSNLDLSNNMALTDLNCYGSKLNSLNVSKNTALECLNCYNNELSSLDLSKSTALEILCCWENQIAELRLNSQTYDKLILTKGNLHGSEVSLSDWQNITGIEESIWNGKRLRLKVTDITKPATYKVNGKAYTIIYVDTVDDIDPDEPLDTTPAPHFYEGHDYNTQATNSTIQIYANGGAVAEPGSTKKKNYKRCVLYTDIRPSYIYTPSKNGEIKPSSGKVVVGITTSDQKPTLVKGKIVDKNASKIASASIKSGQITVTAKSQPGKVYLWVIDTGKNAEAACIPVTIKAAPTKTYIFSIPDTDPSFAYGTTKQFNKGNVGVGQSIKVYLYPAYKQNRVMQKAKNVRYTASVAAKAADCFTVTQFGSNPYCFEICAKNLKGGRSVTGAITFTCSLNGKKTVFKATATNPVTHISTANEIGLTKKANNAFSIKASDTAKISGTFELQPVCASSTDATTDKLKIYAMGSANGYNAAKLEAGNVQITAKKTSEQSKVSMKAAKDKKTVTVAVAKGAKPVTAYFLVVYNTVNNGDQKGYEVVSVTVE